MFRQIRDALKKPQIYTQTDVSFWNDEYISKQMLKAHLDPDFEGASRKLSFINRSVDWITHTVPPEAYPRLLDLGCGPGLYAERFARQGYQVTGIDYSNRSIEHARKSALSNGLSIEYHYQNYLNMEFEHAFDFAVMIYCDYGALSDADRKNIMQKAFRSLKPGGKFLLDVFSMAQYSLFGEKQTWEHCHQGGFWRDGEYIALQGYYKYEPNVTLEQIAVLSEDTVTPYYLWTTCFSQDTLTREAEEAGFQVCGIFGDAAGAPYDADSPTLAILLEK